MFESVAAYLPPFLGGNPQIPSFEKKDLYKTVQKGCFEEAVRLIDEGADPFQKDQYGYSAIDYAILSGKVRKVPLLLGDSELSGSIQTDDLKFKKKVLQMLERDPYLFEFIKKLVEKKNPADPPFEKSPLFKLYIETFQSYGQQMGSLKVGIIHLIALFGTVEQLEELLKLSPESAHLKDGEGHTALHYAALNSFDKHLFKNLLSQGDLFTKNHQGKTPFTYLVAQVQSQDPLQWDVRDLLLVLQNYLPFTLQMLFESGLISQEWPLFLGGNSDLAAMLRICDLYSTCSILLDKPSVPLKKLFIVLLYYNTAFIPLLNLPFRAWVIYKFALKAFQAIKIGYIHYPMRPLKSLGIALVPSLNVLTVGQTFFEELSINWSFFTNFFEKIPSVCDESFSKDCLSDTLKNFLWAIMKHNPALDKIVKEGMAEYQKTYKSDFNYYSPYGIAKMNLKMRLKVVEDPDSLQGAADIFQTNLFIACKQGKLSTVNKDLYKKGSRILHPDKTIEDSGLFMKLGIAKKRLEKFCKSK